MTFTQNSGVISTLEELLAICQDVGENGKDSEYYCKPLEVDLDILFALEDDYIDPETGDRNYVIKPVHNQRNHVAHAEDLEEQYEERGGHVDGIGTDYHLAVPTRDFDVYNDDGVITYNYHQYEPAFQNGNSRRHLLMKNKSYRPASNTTYVRIKSYDDHPPIKSDYKLIDNKNNAQSSKDDIYGALRSHSIHNKVKGIIARGEIARVVKYSVNNRNLSTFKSIGEYKDDYVCLSNIEDYDSGRGSFMGKGNPNRPCAITASLMILKETHRESNTKAIISEIIEEGKVMHDNPSDYWGKILNNFGVVDDYRDSTFKSIKYPQYKLTPIQRILWETFYIPGLPDDLRVDRSYFGLGAQYQFTGWKRIVSFYLYMIQRARDTNNAIYQTEKRKDNQYVNIFGGAYSSRNNMKVVNSPYNVVYNNIFDDNN